MDPLYKMCWECYCGPPEDDPIRAQMLMKIDQQSALLLWLLFCKLDTDDGRLKLHYEVCIHVFIRTYIIYMQGSGLSLKLLITIVAQTNS